MCPEAALGSVSIVIHAMGWIAGKTASNREIQSPSHAAHKHAYDRQLASEITAVLGQIILNVLHARMIEDMHLRRRQQLLALEIATWNKDQFEGPKAAELHNRLLTLAAETAVDIGRRPIFPERDLIGVRQSDVPCAKDGYVGERFSRVCLAD